ncbi:phosphoglycerate mutase-like protein [Bimuria novae-zelandiae CBS 107.79]|uniref:Phosphoglycerate mutase-like protein n=1 Tax=Bimuria novae-zelandiae CBS 107.79 TaxID=1447943 RepID=A0A6A5US51_9PLEO|nr:phosphoglycerate mutase-like protein [Bimuria novae-zelandiae CBS 107.79]
MPPTLLLIRHAQALHNVAGDWSIHDPPLSELGERQCKELQESLRNSQIGNEVELIVVSSMRRTLQTANIGLEWLIKEKGVKLLPDAGWQENADKPCDTGSSISTMAKEFPDFDFSTVDPLYPDKTSNLSSNPYASTRRAILARGQVCLQSLYSRPEKVIAVLSHSGFLRAAVCNRHFFNADWRVFDYDEERMKESKSRGEGVDGQGMFLLKEWKETEERGGGMGRSEIGVFGPETADFPPGVEEEETREVPARPSA